MNFKEYIQPGIKKETTFVVEEQYTASHVGSGSLRVLATPSMIAFMERTASALLEELLPEGHSSVGVHVDIRHIAVTPMGGNVKVVSEVLDVSGRLVDFRVQAWDSEEKIGEGYHQRAVIEVERFLKRVQAKQV